MKENKLLYNMNNLINEINNGAIWKGINKEFPIEFEFIYPNGKHGDIDLYFISMNGKFKQLSALSFLAELQSTQLSEIEIMGLFYYTSFSQNSLKNNRGNNEQLIRFLKEYNNIKKLDDLYQSAIIQLDYNELTNNSIINEALKLIKKEYTQIKEKRNLIYNDLVSTQKTSARWKSEQQVFAIAKKFYNDAIYQYQAEWLGKLSLDIFIPSIKTGIEYQGIQHYEPIDIFGGEEHFIIQRQNDERKRQLCSENGIKLIEWKYDIAPNENNFKKMLLLLQ